jgi:hypothetical protein
VPTDRPRADGPTRYCTLLGRTLFYTHAVSHDVVGCIRLRGVTALNVDSAEPDSDVEEEGAVLGEKTSFGRFGITISSPDIGLYHFIATSEEERDKWLFFLQMAAGEVPVNVGTPTEKALRLLDTGAVTALDSPQFSQAAVFHHAAELTSPLTTLLSAGLEQLALSTFKSVELFASVPVVQGAAEYHVLLAQGIIEQCLNMPELHNELYCQLIKQCTPPPAQPPAHNLADQHRHVLRDHGPLQAVGPLRADGGAGGASSDSRNGGGGMGGGASGKDAGPLLVQYWQLLILCIPIFLPSTLLVRYLELHLERGVAAVKQHHSEGKLAGYGLRCLQRHASKGGRTSPPSRVRDVAARASHFPGR